MKVRSKILIAMSSVILTMGISMYLITFIYISNWEADQAKLMNQNAKRIEQIFLDHYRSNQQWVNLTDLTQDLQIESPQQEVLLVSQKGKVLFHHGSETEQEILAQGRKVELKHQGKFVGDLYVLNAKAKAMEESQKAFHQQFLMVLLRAFTLITIIVLLFGVWLAHLLTKPLGIIVEGIKKIKQQSLDVRIPIVTNDEYGEVGQALNQMCQRLSKSEKLRKQMIADLSHELRTPVTIMKSQLENFQQTGVAIPVHELLPLHDECIRLSHLVDDLYQLTLADSGNLRLEIKSVEMVKLIKAIVRKLSFEFESKQLAIQIDTSEHEIWQQADPRRMEQVLVNLLFNAIQYSEEGGKIELSVERTSTDTQICVTDNGPGIPQEQLPYVFERFYRVEEGRSRNTGGMGLGLAIVKEFIKAHGGTIQVESECGKGTTFFIQLPLQIEAV